MAYRNKTYVCFDADTDIWAYRFMKGWNANDNLEFNFNNAHELNNLREGSSEETIKRKLRERMENTNLLIVLIGEKTKNLFRFVRWEMEIAKEMKIPIVGVNLDRTHGRNDGTCPAIIRNDLVLYIPYKQAALHWALKHWRNEHRVLKLEGKSGPMVFSAALRIELGV